MALGRWAVPLALVACLIGSSGAARGDHFAVIAVPGKRGVPVIINGRNAAGAMVIGDWGLYRPGHMAVEVVPLRQWRLPPRVRRTYVKAHRYSGPRKSYRLRKRHVPVRYYRRHYFPGGAVHERTKRPANEYYDGPPQPAEHYRREWTSSPAQLPVNTEPPAVVEINPVIEVNPGEGGTRSGGVRPSRRNR